METIFIYEQLGDKFDKKNYIIWYTTIRKFMYW